MISFSLNERYLFYFKLMKTIEVAAAVIFIDGKVLCVQKP